MNLYAFQPHGHGPRSFFVMAVTEHAAIEFVNEYIKTELAKGNHCDHDGWPHDYKMTALEMGQVIENDND